jgi:catalase
VTRRKHSDALALAVIAVALWPAGEPRAQDADPQPIVEIMRAFAGPGQHRPSGAKGRCYAGEFVPSAEARNLSKAVIFTRPSQALIRFSVGGGNPNVADGARGPNRGLSFRIDADGPGQTEFVMVNAPINFARTPQQMLGFLEARRPAANGQPDPERVRAFSEANPETLAQARYLASRPIPGSWVGVNYWGLHAYTLTNAAGVRQTIKFRMVPIDGDVNLTDDEARARPRDFLADEMTARLASGRPVGLRMVAIMGRAGDPTNDVTRMWDGEDTRPTVDLGTLFVRAAAEAARCDGTIFAPTILADGIEGPENDPMFAIRTPAYAISITQRRP